jgi:hypothetical protein
MATKKPAAAKTIKAAAPEAPDNTPEEGGKAEFVHAMEAGDRGEVVAAAYDNEAENDSTCVCTLTFADGSTSQGSAARTDNLAADQAQARSKALNG